MTNAQPTLPEQTDAAPTAPGAEWWRSAVIYQVYPRSFADGDGDGIGDLPGALARIDDLADLGIDAVWFSPFMPSPQKDAGYDVSDYTDVDALFGTLADLDAFVAAAHERGIRVIVDLVPNHTSDAHAWFREALAAEPGSAARARYLFRDGRGPGGDEPPNNWQSVFGGPAWTRTRAADGAPGQWYLHLFDASQPDLDWSSDEVRSLFRDVLRFWLDRGIDGFRVDVAHGMVKAEGLPDFSPAADGGSMGGDEAQAPYWGQEGVHEIYRDWNSVLAEYDGERILCAEAWVSPLARMADWVRPDEMQQAFNFPYLETPWLASALRAVIDESLAAFGAVGAPSTWVLSNHDVVRHASRLAIDGDNPQGHGIGPASPHKPDAELGLRRARAASALMLALPGGAYVYQGEELGLPEVVELPDESRQDPTWFRTNGERYGRDGCRVPIPWERGAPAAGFSATGESWLPQPEGWGDLARDAQRGDAASTLELYRTLLAHRRERGLGLADLAWLDTDDDAVLALRVGSVVVLANTGPAPWRAPASLAGLPALVSSDPGAVDAGRLADATLPADATVWLDARSVQ